MAQRVVALRSLVSRHHAPVGYTRTLAELGAFVGVTDGPWTEDQLLTALGLLQLSRADSMAFDGCVNSS